MVLADCYGKSKTIRLFASAGRLFSIPSATASWHSLMPAAAGVKVIRETVALDDDATLDLTVGLFITARGPDLYTRGSRLRIARPVFQTRRSLGIG